MMKVAIVTHGIVGPILGGGIATAYYHLARFLAQEGREVEIIYARGRYTEGGRSIEQTIEIYRQQGILFTPLPGVEGLTESEPPFRPDAYEAYRYLKGRHYDVIHFPDFRAVGYYTLLARSLGLACAATRFVVSLHGPTFWHDVEPVPIRREVLELAHMERTTAELADVVTSPSAYMLASVRQHGWPLPRRTRVIPNIYHPDAGLAARQGSPRPVEGFTYFARLEPRKGLSLFLDALVLFLERTTDPVRVVFLGKPGLRHRKAALVSRIRQRLAGYAGRVRLEMHQDLDTLQAQALLVREQGQMACMPSLQENHPYTVLECLALGVPFLTSDVGGIHEPIHPEDRHLCLFEPRAEALAASMQRWFGQVPPVPRPDPSFCRGAELWRELHAELEQEPVPPPRPAPPHPRVCIVMDSPQEQAQTYANLVTAVDAADYLLFMVAGAVLRPEAVATLVQAAVHAQADVLVPAWQEVTGGTTPILCLPTAYLLMPGLLMGSGVPPVIMVRRQVYLELQGGKRPDAAFLARALLSGRRLWELPEVLADCPPPAPTADYPLAYLDRLQQLQPYSEAMPPGLRDLPRLVLAMQNELAELRAYSRPVYRLLRRGLEAVARAPRLERLARRIFDALYRPAPQRPVA